MESTQLVISAPVLPSKKRTILNTAKVRTGCVTWWVSPLPFMHNWSSISYPSLTQSTASKFPSLESHASPRLSILQEVISVFVAPKIKLLTLPPPHQRLRRVKCDEAKPDCNRCVSTGRKCDGYQTFIRVLDPTRSSSMKMRAASQRPPPSAGPECVASLSHGIEGTQAERRFFSNYIRFTSAGSMFHPCNSPRVWTKLAPQLAHHHEEAKHAMVAFGAAYQRFNLSNGGTTVGSLATHTIDQLDRFILQQYNRAIQKLCKRSCRHDVESTKLVLTCCLIFICLESLRLNHHAAIWHLNNGIRIIESTFGQDDDVDAQADSAQKRDRVSPSSDGYLQDLITQFQNYQVCLQGVSPSAPSILNKLHKRSQHHCEAHQPPLVYTKISDCHEARMRLGNDVMSLEWQLGKSPSDPGLLQELHHLQHWAAQVDDAIEAFFAGPFAPPPRIWSRFITLIDVMHVICLAGALELMVLSPEDHTAVIQSDAFQDRFVRRIVKHGDAVHRAFTSADLQQSDFALETALVGPMRWAHEHSCRPVVTAQALEILEQTTQNMSTANV